MLIIHSNLQLVTLKLQNFSLFLRYSGIYFYKLNLLFQFTRKIKPLDFFTNKKFKPGYRPFYSYTLAIQKTGFLTASGQNPVSRLLCFRE